MPIEETTPPGTLVQWPTNKPPPAGWAWHDFPDPRRLEGLVQVGMIVKLADEERRQSRD